MTKTPTTATLKAVLRLSREEIAEAEALLELDHPAPDAERDEVLMSWTAPIGTPHSSEPETRQADIKIINGDSGPWAEVVLSNGEGVEIARSNVDDHLFGEWPFDVGGEAITVHVVEGGKEDGCLAGMACPECFGNDYFKIAVTSWATVLTDGVDAHDDNEWDDDSACACGNCGFSGHVYDFLNPEPEE